MTYDPDTQHRRSIRIPQFDYAQPGVYFVTVCTHQRECTLGNIDCGVMIPNACGEIASQYWAQIPARFPNVAVTTFVVMPNHTHANIVILDNPSCANTCRGGVSPPRLPCALAGPPGGETPPLQPTLGQIVAYYKYQTTKAVNLLREMPGARFWQRNYWEHVIRNESELRRIEEYIQGNPARWSADQLHPDALPNAFNKD